MQLTAQPLAFHFELAYGLTPAPPTPALRAREQLPLRRQELENVEGQPPLNSQQVPCFLGFSFDRLGPDQHRVAGLPNAPEAQQRDLGQMTRVAQSLSRAIAHPEHTPEEIAFQEQRICNRSHYVSDPVSAQGFNQWSPVDRIFPSQHASIRRCHAIAVRT
jgi:hypothetical protein